MLEAKLEFDAKATLGEGPCWDVRRQLLYGFLDAAPVNTRHIRSEILLVREVWGLE